ncbi:hypothetical protein BGZ61DRAFT_534934 [Ilyonectria robusta]|uniref:uncharacterized protein n=1 Tax=Ilyonectria robusta TaxID=1079257 RepID=UPI001E8E1439|nr:uncharacterized protein BGZ61DRAFT_534934 [Ilyonectria robusta]KAH8683493.1 hypothetical protein BGZ61DRAFT_534934 [Ilyonectria robusta]
MAEECMGELCLNIILRGFLTLCVIAIDKHIVGRRDTVVRLGRQCQDLLRVPECMRVFADVDPGMQNGEIRMAAEFLGLAGLLNALGVLILVAKGTFWCTPAWCIGAVFPGVLVLVLWTALLVSKRRLLRSPALLKDPIAAAEEGDPGLQRSINSVTADAWMAC